MADVTYRNQIKMLVEPTKNDHVTTKKYVDDTIEERADELSVQRTTLVWGINIIPASRNIKWRVY